MTTIWEMAETVRAEEGAALRTIRMKPAIDHDAGDELAAAERPIDLRESERMEYWCKSLGATRMQLFRAVAHVGPDPTAVRRFLTTRFFPEHVRA
jgi:hypothetical protein